MTASGRSRHSLAEHRRMSPHPPYGVERRDCDLRAATASRSGRCIRDLASIAHSDAAGARRLGGDRIAIDAELQRETKMARGWTAVRWLLSAATAGIGVSPAAHVANLVFE
jgi:hypothetical protein